MASAAAHDGAQLSNVVTKDNPASTVGAGSACPSKTNDEWLKDNGLKSERTSLGPVRDAPASRRGATRARTLAGDLELPLNW
ncbi:hypothetical protein QA648_27985 (plasmid) [Rhizobium sp. CB3171]|uniref:hypothetical protein n=1 Tax=Rhizobium sp. CB3171 TaxID=3039157 RepID=UPI0024B14AFF|nr:hypothetical protein [Rhizobium sp. CB3171]WFU04618.1 hypothetical protein QA648_27985 [Rhizobium sp. CB3171]